MRSEKQVRKRLSKHQDDWIDAKKRNAKTDVIKINQRIYELEWVLKEEKGYARQRN